MSLPLLPTFVGYRHSIVLIIGCNCVGRPSKNSDRPPSEGLVDQGSEIWEALPIFEYRETVRADNLVQFRLSFTHSVREMKHCH